MRDGDDDLLTGARSDDKERKGEKRDQRGIFNGIVRTVFPARSSWSLFVTGSDAASRAWEPSISSTDLGLQLRLELGLQ